VRRLKGSVDSTHTLEPDTAKALKRLQGSADGLYVFRSEQGNPLSVDAVQLICKRAGEVAGLGFQCHPHQLRPCVRVLLGREGHGYVRAILNDPDRHHGDYDPAHAPTRWTEIAAPVLSAA
jgi:Phage integrase family